MQNLIRRKVSDGVEKKKCKIGLNYGDHSHPHSEDISSSPDTFENMTQFNVHLRRIIMNTSNNSSQSSSSSGKDKNIDIPTDNDNFIERSKIMITKSKSDIEIGLSRTVSNVSSRVSNWSRQIFKEKSKSNKGQVKFEDRDSEKEDCKSQVEIEDKDEIKKGEKSEKLHGHFCCLCNTIDLEKEESEMTKSNRSGYHSYHSSRSRSTSNISTAASAFLEMLKDCRYYFQHPYIRIFTAYFVVFCNFLFYAQDPMSHSMVDIKSTIVGHNYNFIFDKYPPSAWSLLKVFMWLAGISVGVLVGKYMFHKLLFNRILRLQIFSNNQGVMMTVFICVPLGVFGFSEIYNAFLLDGYSGYDLNKYLIDSHLHVTTRTFNKITATGTWFGDFITAFMVTDVMLQERLYPLWAKKMRKWWNVKFHRIYMFWFSFCFASTVVIYAITTLAELVHWDSFSVDYAFNNEIWRMLLVASILVMDMTIVMQDWDFPHFVNVVDIKLPGFEVPEIKFRIIPKLNWWAIISGKWVNYGVLLFVTVLDINNLVGQITYNPTDYSQYTHPENHRIYNAKDELTINNLDNKTLLSFAYRNCTINPLTGKLYIEGDILLSAKFIGFDDSLKAVATIPVVTMSIVFVTLFARYGRYPAPTKENPYIGRVIEKKKKIPKRRRMPSRIETARRIGSLLGLNSPSDKKDINEDEITVTSDSPPISPTGSTDPDLSSNISDHVSNLDKRSSVLSGRRPSVLSGRRPSDLSGLTIDTCSDVT